MTIRPLRQLLALVALAALPARTLAGGITLYEVGSPDVGLAAAGYGARAQDASTVLSNPAGMARLGGTQLMLGAQLLYGNFGFEPDGGTSSGLGTGDGGNPIGWFPGGGLFVTHAVSPTVTLGLAAAGTFGMALGYDDGWVGRYYVDEATLMGISLLPSVAWRATDELSLGATVHGMYGILDQKVALNTATGADGGLALDATAWGIGANVGVLWEPSKATRFGLVYTSPVKLDFSTKPEFTGVGPGLGLLLAATGLDEATVDLGITVPQGVMASAYHAFDARWAILGSVGWQQWSQFGLLEVGIPDTTNPLSLTRDLDFDDTWHFAVGGQLTPAPGWRVDAGVAYDTAFQGDDVSPMLPVNDGWRLSAGFRKEGPKLGWGFSAEYSIVGSPEVDREGEIPVALGGRGDLSGAYEDSSILFLAFNLDWKT
jgi:long-chain fatty acid transport protein